MTHQPDKNSSICIQLYFSVHKRLQNGREKKKWKRKKKDITDCPSLQNPTELPPDHGDSGLCSQCLPTLRVPGPWLTGETLPCSFWMQEEANQSNAWDMIEGALCCLLGAACLVLLAKCQGTSGYTALFPCRNTMLLPWRHQSFTEEPTGRQWWLRN